VVWDFSLSLSPLCFIVKFDWKLEEMKEEADVENGESTFSCRLR